MRASGTFFAPGQRYIGSNVSPWHKELQLTILAVEHNFEGPAFVTYRGPLGDQTTAPAEELEDALAQGRIIPVTEDFTLLVS